MRPQSHRAALVPARGVAFPLLLLWWLPLIPPLWQALLPGAPELVVDPGVGVSGASRLQFAILALLALAGSGWRPSRPAGARSAGLWAALFLAWSVLSALSGGDPIESLLFVLGWAAAAAVVWSAPAALPVRTGARWRALTLYGPLLMLGLIALEPALRESGDFRAAGPFQLPGTLANWLLMVLPLALSGLFRAERRELPWALLGTSFGLASLVLTVSRAAWLAGLVALVLLLLLEAEASPSEMVGWSAFGGLGLLGLVALRAGLGPWGLLVGSVVLAALPVGRLALAGRLPRQTLFRLLLVGVLAGLLVNSIRSQQSLGELTQRRMASLTGADDSAVGRIQFWRAALELSLRHPLLGIGPDRFSEAYPQVQEQYYYFSDSAHGTMVELLSEVGWVGGVLFGAALIALVARAELAPQSKPWQRAPLVGLMVGGLYSQVEVGYHFAVMWTTAAFLLAVLARDENSSPPAYGRFSPWPLPALIVLILFFPSARDHQLSSRLSRPEDGYRLARQVSDRWPVWGRPALSALSLGLTAGRPPAELRPLAERALESAPDDAASYQMAAELDLAQARYSEALANLSRARQLDPFNRPRIYHGLLLVAQAGGDTALEEATINDVLRVYDLEKGWAIAHPGHRQKLAAELGPLLQEIAGRLERRGQTERARQLLEEARRLDPAYAAP